MGFVSRACDNQIDKHLFNPAPLAAVRPLPKGGSAAPTATLVVKPETLDSVRFPVDVTTGLVAPVSTREPGCALVALADVDPPEVPCGEIP